MYVHVGHQSLTSGMQLRKNILVSGNADSNVKVCSANSEYYCMYMYTRYTHAQMPRAECIITIINERH